MTKKELLQLYYLKKEIKEQNLRIAELEALATKANSTVTDMPYSINISDKVGTYASELSDLKNLLDLNIKKCLFELNKLNKYIQNLDDSEMRLIFKYRYISGLT